MYSYEMKQFLMDRNWCVTKDEYYSLSDNPQVSSIKYNAWEDSYEIVTDDGYYFKFTVRS